MWRFESSLRHSKQGKDLRQSDVSLPFTVPGTLVHFWYIPRADRAVALPHFRREQRPWQPSRNATKSFRILFVYQGKRHSITLGKVKPDEAEAKAGQVDLLLLRIKQGLLTLPAGVVIEDFLLHDGQVEDGGGSGRRRADDLRPVQGEVPRDPCPADRWRRTAWPPSRCT